MIKFTHTKKKKKNLTKQGFQTKFLKRKHIFEDNEIRYEIEFFSPNSTITCVVLRFNVFYVF